MMAAESLKLVISREIPSQNVRDRRHWRDRHADTQTFQVLLRAAVKRLPMRPSCKMRVRIVSLRARLIDDNANLRGGAKGLVDALVRLGFIRDDSDDAAHITYEQHYAPKALRCTRITIAPESP